MLDDENYAGFSNQLAAIGLKLRDITGDGLVYIYIYNMCIFIDFYMMQYIYININIVSVFLLSAKLVANLKVSFQ